jgi:hypothetical protein
MDKAAAWLIANGYSNANPIESERAYEFKQREVTDFVPGTLIVSEIGEGIKAITGQCACQPQSETELLEMSNLIRASL